MQEHIKISAAPPRIQYVGDGVQREFFFPFAIFKPEHVEVFLDGERLASGVTVQGAGESAGGSAILQAAPGEGVLVTVRRRMVVERTTDFQPAGAFSARLINDEFDYLTAALQQVAADTETSLRLAPTEPIVDMTLPAVPARADRMLSFDASGRPRLESRHEVAGRLAHGNLSGLDGDDHAQYLTEQRADAWIATKSLDDLHDGFTVKRYSAQEKGKLAALPANAEANPPRVSEAEKLSGAEWEPRTFSPRDVVDLARRFVNPGGGGSGVSVHAMLVGLSADDHLQYLTADRADAWLAGKTADVIPEGAVNRYMRLAGGGTAATAARSDHGHDAGAIFSGILGRARLPLLSGDAGSGGQAGAAPAPAAGDAFYRTDLAWLFVYDGVRSKWLGELETDGAGRSGSHSAGYLAGIAGAVMSSSVGILVPYDVTIVGVSMVWTTATSGALNIVRNGVTIGTQAFASTSTSTSTSAMTLNVDFAAGGILAFSTSGHGTAMTNPQLRCWWRRRAS